MVKEKFNFTVRDFEIKERSEESEGLDITICAIKETTSRNGITYLAKNLAEGARSFKDMHVSVDHTWSASDIVGRTRNPRMEGKKLKVDTTIYNTAKYPDAIQMFERELWKDFSIEADANIIEVKDKYVAEDIEFLGLAIVDIPGVKGAKRESLSFEEAMGKIIAERASNIQKIESETMENSEKELEKQIALNEGFKEANVALSESLVALTAEIKEIKEKKPDVSIESIASLNEKIASQDKLVKELSEKLDAVKEAADADVALGGDESKLVFEKFGGKTNIFKE